MSFCMDKTFGVMDMSNETAKFNKAVELFFGMNPTKRFWILLAFYFAKIGKLRIIDNYDETHEGFVMASMPLSLITNVDVVAQWMKSGIIERSVVAFVPDSQKNLINQIYFDVDEANSSNVKGKFILGELSQMEPTFLVEIAETLTRLTDEWFEHNGQWAFDMLVNRAMHTNGLSKTCTLPSEITNLMVSILNAQVGKVYNPYAGICSLGAAISSDCEYYGQEYSKSYLIGQLNLLFNSKDNAVCEQKNSVIEWNAAEHFDYIVSVPPFGVMCDSEYRTIENDFLFHSAQDASRKAIGIYSTRICFGRSRDAHFSVVSDLVNKDFIEAVILLPSKVFSFTNIETVVVVVNKQKPQKGEVRFVDASNSFIKNGRRNYIQVEETLNLCSSDNDRSKSVPISEIVENGYNLYPKMYLYKGMDIPEGMKSFSLSDVLTPLQLKRPRQSYGRVLSILGNKMAEEEDFVKCAELKSREVDGRIYREINEDCLLWTKFVKPFLYLETEGEAVCVRADFKAFRVNTQLIDVQYLLTELRKDYFVKQLERFGENGFGGLGQHMTVADFLNCKVLVPVAKSGQEVAVLKYKESLLDSRAKELVETYQRKFDEFVHCQRQRKHHVAQVLNEIMPTVDVISEFIDTNDTVSKDSVVSKRSGKSLGDYLASLEQLMLKVSHMVDKFTADEKFSPVEDFNLNEFLPKYIEEKNISDKFEITFSPSMEDIDDFFDILDGDNKSLSNFKVAVSREDLILMLDNLIDNAKKYGFVDENQKYEIVIGLSRYNDNMPGMACISVSNNGELVSENMDLNKLFAWGEGHGSGIGCWQVKNIAEHFGGTVTYEEDVNSPYPCNFDIYLPLIED